MDFRQSHVCTLILVTKTEISIQTFSSNENLTTFKEISTIGISSLLYGLTIFAIFTTDFAKNLRICLIFHTFLAQNYLWPGLLIELNNLFLLKITFVKLNILVCMLSNS